MKGDLHCHTRLSDGSEGIEEVISRGKRAGMDFLAITDHDTVASMSRAKVLADRYGVQVIPGVEFSSRDPKTGRKVHVLCYLPEKPDRLEGLCVRLCESRKKAGRAMIQKLTRYFPVSVEDVLRFSKHSTAIYKQHIMHALMCYGYTTHIFGGLYHELFDPKTGVLLSKVEYPEVDEVIDLIHQAQGLAVLAHPYEYDSIDLMKRLVSEEKLDGIEVYHSRCPQEKEGFLKQVAQEHGLIMTGGSDFHGFYASRPSPIGNRYTSQESLDALFRAKEQKRQASR
ncbi:error-prone DNA polymerase [uncultured Ruminococcus sp.]|uniref:PHP domain-containing protein n=1 Tax=Massiliimalia timonensis TaxID=1987501 RepID=A0A8J6P8V0_9FIRM|nr:PHP domain-containing protein [Massiliimalia timonensis]MBC8611865.1 PHP domain-containing protein [Massiliimalia timonensis]SCH55028.1 error-prone DNA polymerase [uncultured Clostridium sp.]SCH66356.1 error-prone DNA polymerase [uncultured Ruminococcus sp.]